MMGLMEEIYLFGNRIRIGKRKLSAENLSTLTSRFAYYRALDPNLQNKFLGRLIDFMATKEFVPRGGLKEVTNEMKVLIGAVAVMVAFGFREVRYRHFSKILVYPDPYYSTINRQYHVGEVNPRLGIIVLSWSSFVKAFSHPSDGISLGIHEMAHALKLENQIYFNQGNNFFGPRAWRLYAALAQEEIKSMKNGLGSFFRPSAMINEHEFFAVALESFFEKPLIFRNYNFPLYKAMVNLMRQDPLLITGNPSI